MSSRQPTFARSPCVLDTLLLKLRARPETVVEQTNDILVSVRKASSVVVATAYWFGSRGLDR
jgi:hypothetical protein